MSLLIALAPGPGLQYDLPAGVGPTLLPPPLHLPQDKFVCLIQLYSI